MCVHPVYTCGHLFPFFSVNTRFYASNVLFSFCLFSTFKRSALSHYCTWASGAARVHLHTWTAIKIPLNLASLKHLRSFCFKFRFLWLQRQLIERGFGNARETPPQDNPQVFSTDNCLLFSFTLPTKSLRLFYCPPFVRFCAYRSSKIQKQWKSSSKRSQPIEPRWEW